MGEFSDASVFRVWGSHAFVCDTSTDKLSARAIPCDVTFDESVPFYRLFPYHSAPLPPLPLFLALGPPPVDPLPPQGLAPSGVSQVDPLPGSAPVEVAVGSGAAQGAVSGGAASGGAEPGVAESEGVGFGGAEPGGEVDPLPGTAPVEVAVHSGAARGAASRGAASGGAGLGDAELGGAGSEGAESGGAEHGGAEPMGEEPGGAESEGVEPGGAEPRGSACSGGAGVTGGAGGTRGAVAGGPRGACIRGTGAAGTGSVGGAGAGGAGVRDLAELEGARIGGAGAGSIGFGGAGVGGAGAGGPGARGAGVGGTGAGELEMLTVELGVLFLAVVVLEELPEALLSVVSLHLILPRLFALFARRVPRQRPPIPGTHTMALCPSSIPLRVPLPPPPMSSLPAVPDPESDLAHAAFPTVSRLLATVVTDPSFESTAASALIVELVDFAAACRLDYATALVAESESTSPPSVWGECALGMYVLENRQEDFECLAAAVPRFASMLLAPEGIPDAPDIPTPRSYAEAITGPYSSQWQTAMDAEMASWKSTCTYVDTVPPSRASIGVDFFHTFSPTPKMTTLWVLLHVAAQRDYELHSLDFSTAFLQGSLHEEIWLRLPPGFTGSFPAGTQWSLQRPVYGLRQAPRKWHDTLRTTLAAVGFTPSTADPSLFLCTDTSMLPFYVLMYVNDLVFAIADTKALTLVKLELKKRHICIDLGELRNYLGLQITRDREWYTITLIQSHMVHQVLQRFGFQFSSPQPTPLSSGHSL
ncbi:unnamed protein product [Closterium sp. NIES-54]